MADNVRVYGLSLDQLARLGGLAHSGDWARLWNLLDVQAEEVTPRYAYPAELLLTFVDWLGSEERINVPTTECIRDWWEEGTWRELAHAGIVLVACMDTKGGRKLLKAFHKRHITAKDAEGIVDAYGLRSNDAVPGVAGAIDLLRGIAGMAVSGVHDRILILAV